MYLHLFQKKTLLLFFVGVSLLAVSCAASNSEDSTSSSPATQVLDQSSISKPTDDPPGSSTGYPSPSSDIAENSGYPSNTSIIEGLSSDPPNPDVNLPAADENYGTVGGVLVQEIIGQGYLPLEPLELSLAEIIKTTDGNPAFIRENANSPKAELFPTGVFIFRNVPPGDYGIMVDVGYAKFPIRGDDGNQILISVAAGQAIDIGQLITKLP